MDGSSSLYREGGDSIFLGLFGRSPKTRLIDLFLDNPFFDLSRMEMVEALGMAKITVYKNIPLLEAMDIIMPSRKIGKTQLYRLNGSSPVVKDLRNIIKEISFKIAELEMEGNDETIIEPQKSSTVLSYAGISDETESKS